MRLNRRPALGAVTLLALLLLAAPGLARAQAAAPQGGTRIGIIDLQAVLKTAPGYAQAESTYAREMRTYESEVEKLQKQFDSTLAAYQQQSVVLSPSAKQTKETELRNLQQRMQQRAAELQGKAQTRERELIEPIEERVRAVVEGVRAERNIGVIFDRTTLLAADRTLDITQVVIQRLKSAGPQ